MNIRVLIVDDEQLVRTGFRAILETQSDISVVGEADDGGAAVRAAIRLSPDVVLMDIRMRSTDGLEATRTIMARVPRPPKIVVLTTFDYDERVRGPRGGRQRLPTQGFPLKNSSSRRFEW